MMLRRLASLLVALALTSVTVPPAAARGGDRPLVVFAAASLKNALDAVAADWTRREGVEVRVSYAGSPALARQIAEGAPADIFISADIPWMDDLDGKGLARAGTRRNLLGNALVIVAGPGWSGGDIAVEPGFGPADKLGEGRLAVADVAAVPAGRYAQAALRSLGVWNSAEPKLVQAENVRAALALVARGEAPLGIVYATDARAEPKVRIVGRFPEGSHPPITYPAAVLKRSTHGKARAFLDHLSGDDARPRFEHEGFTVIARELAN